MLTPAEAAAAIAAELAPLAAESCALADAAGRVLREELAAERDQPPFDRVAMDGIAVASEALAAGRRAFRIAGTVAAGRPPATLPGEDACLEVMTGAMLPPGTDTVIPVESLVLAEGRATLREEAPPARYANVHRRASDARAGSRALAAGTRLRGPELAIAASAGRAALAVSREPRIAVISTGDELVGPGLALEPWQIRRSNAYGVAATLALHGYARLSDDHIADDPATLCARLAAHLTRHDVLILSGGVSAGRFDHVPASLESVGVRRVFHKVAQRPGKPLWFGVGPGGQPVFALPGNPVSTLVCLIRYVLPALERLCGAPAPAVPSVPLADGYESRHPLTAFVPVDRGRAAGRPAAVTLHPTHGSGDFTALAGTAGFVELAPGRRIEPGEAVPIYTW
ncbi:MAG TPA: molybdopterin molybdotransferase MoeA [Steroidobacteraceae bacterium]|nr:molybdopterin molybdotransferase MoeA [Steroidobacteraceae bacterium]